MMLLDVEYDFVELFIEGMFEEISDYFYSFSEEEVVELMEMLNIDVFMLVILVENLLVFLNVLDLEVVGEFFDEVILVVLL